MTTKQRQVEQQIILSHARKPLNKGRTNRVDREYRSENPYCGDTIELSLTIDQATDEITDAKFVGSGCALCLASADLMASAIVAKKLTEALLMAEQFREMVAGNTRFTFPLDKLNIMQGVSQYPVRVKCVTLPWHTLKSALESQR